MSRSAFRHRGQSRTLLPAMAPSPPADGNGSSGEEQGSRHSHESPLPATEPGQQSRQPVSIGEQLTAARHRLGVSIAQASSDTRIEPGSLEALEADAPIDDFVGPAYARLFLKHYAGYLHLDGEALLEAFDRAHAAPPVQKLPAPAVKVPGGFVTSVLVLASLAAIVAIVLRSSSSVGPPPASELGTSPPLRAPSTAASTPARPSPAAAARGGIRATLAFEEACWVEATVDAKVVLAQTLPAGKRLSFRARRTLRLVLGNGGGVRLDINGKPVPTGGRGQVVHLSWQWQDGRLLRSSA